MPNPTLFYDAFAAHYDLIFEDWEQSMARQGAFIAELIARELRPSGPSHGARVLDAAAGIGTQSLPLAQAGFSVLSRDVSPEAIARLEHEAATRRLLIDAGVADMRTVHTSVSEPVDVVLAFDNSVPHLLSDADILAAFKSFFLCLNPGGACLLAFGGRIRCVSSSRRERVPTHSCRQTPLIRGDPLLVSEAALRELNMRRGVIALERRCRQAELRAPSFELGRSRTGRRVHQEHGTLRLGAALYSLSDTSQSGRFD